jgi:CheY-like chemotaxis protein
LAAADGRHFDLLLSDIVMPGEMDGLALARTLRQRHPQLPILLVTGYSDSGASADEEFTVLRKPYRLADLNRAVAKTVAETGEPAPANLIPLRRARPCREPA